MILGADNAPLPKATSCNANGIVMLVAMAGTAVNELPIVVAYLISDGTAAPQRYSIFKGIQSYDAFVWHATVAPELSLLGQRSQRVFGLQAGDNLAVASDG